MRLVTINDLLSEPAETLNDLVDRATQISQLYDDFIENDEGDGHLRAAGIHASEISQCEKKIVYNLLNTPKKGAIRKNWRQRFELGKAVHAMIQRDFYNMAAKSKGLIQFEAEVPVSPKHQKIAAELQLHSSCDGVFTFRDDPLGPAVLRVGLEIKTEAPDGYDKLKSPKPEHIEQAHVYMKALDLPMFWFLYVNKGNQNNTSSIPPFLIPFDPLIWANLEARCRRLLKLAEQGDLPDRRESIVCEFCPYAHVCEPSYTNKSSQGGSAKWKQMRR